MPDSVYKVIELVGTSTDGWEQAVAAAVARATAAATACSHPSVLVPTSSMTL